jgi:hypothetical protein
LTIAATSQVSEATPLLALIRKIDTVASSLIDSGELRAIFDKLVEAESLEWKSILEESYNLEPNFQFDQLVSMLYATRSQLSARDYNNSKSYHSSALRKWKQIEHLSFQMLKDREVLLVDVITRCRGK